MRPSDLQRLEALFPADDPRSASEQISDALEIGAPSAAVLAKCILDDLDLDTYGVGWWVSHVSTKRRILISDQLHLAVATIETNLIEARLHLLEALDYLERSSRQSQFSVTVGPSGGAHNLKRLPSAAAHLPHELARVHVVGFFRAIGSALDCLGSALIGVLALPLNLLRGDLNKAREKLGRLDDCSSDGAKLRDGFARFFSALVENSGPDGWLKWALDYRNMLVHRGRHWTPRMQHETGVKLWVGPATRKVAFDSILLLSKEPGRGEVDALRGARQGHVLTEDAQLTLQGLYESASGLIEKTCVRLIEIWNERRARPTLLVQPEAQWPDTNLPAAGTFKGYAPNSVDFSPKQIVVSVAMGRRLQAAALDGDLNERWRRLD